ncbi:EmrB/QacA subfamily drug resistance transporter [Tamaricihabitans halophyticus]|uniref:EmrB/QacA subfamily drug resistance transporter n=1 Tax=Tamaricihabitans halophyticus TaxID=1262583 RepID=A0A4R2QWV3_9PSEU|nr:MFS transporter [Tamaricihabitans halophyticus]TCP54197.1 EmrB/QacA subfamily drug resistance transporter [Tamaricihabitans halophyticus]
MTYSGTRRWWALGALSVALLTIGLDTTILNVALPTLATELSASTSELQWFVNSFTLVLAAGLLPAGLCGDRFGQKKLLLVALTVFGAASAWCAYAGSAGMLITARAALGLGAALLIPLSMSMLTRMFHGAERTKAIGVWSAAMALGIPLGPVVGGWLLDHFWWGSIFLINIPLVLVGLLLLGWLLPATPAAPGNRIDGIGVLLSATGLGVLTYGLIEAGEHGWGGTLTWSLILLGGLLLGAFGWWITRARTPLVDPALFSSRGFAWGTLLATVASFVLMGAMFVLPQYFQAVFDATALGTGLRLLPVVGGLLVGVQLANRLRPNVGAKAIVAIGFALLAAGLLIGTQTSVADSYGFVAFWLSVLGVGFGFALPPAMDIAMGALPRSGSGVGSGMLQAARQVGGTLGVALLGTLLGATYRGQLDLTAVPAAAADSAAAGVRVAQTLDAPELLASVRAALVHGMSATLWVCAGIAVLGVILTLVYLPNHAEDVVAEEQGERTGQSKDEHVAG